MLTPESVLIFTCLCGGLLCVSEWLMGWPLGWTDLKPLETDKFQQWLRSHGGF